MQSDVVGDFIVTVDLVTSVAALDCLSVGPTHKTY